MAALKPSSFLPSNSVIELSSGLKRSAIIKELMNCQFMQLFQLTLELTLTGTCCACGLVKGVANLGGVASIENYVAAFALQSTSFIFLGVPARWHIHLILVKMQCDTNSSLTFDDRPECNLIPETVRCLRNSIHVFYSASITIAWESGLYSWSTNCSDNAWVSYQELNYVLSH